MKNLTLLLFLAISLNLFAQRNRVFVDQANVRAKASLKSKVLGTLPFNETINRDYNIATVNDTISGNSGMWVPITYKGQTAYIWDRVLAISYFRSDLDVDYRFLVGLNSSSHTIIKVFYKDTFKMQFVFKDVLINQYTKFGTIGKTYNSNGNEVIVAVYDNKPNDNIVFEWNTVSLKKSAIQLRGKPHISNQDYYPNHKSNYNYCLIKKDQVNIRERPSVRSEKIATLSKFTKVKLLQRDVKFDTVNGVRLYWHKIEWNSKPAYICGNLVSIPVKYIKSNKNDNLDFLYTYGAIYVFRNEKVVYQKIIQENYHVEDIYEMGSLGFGGDYQFIAARVVSYTEGADFGEEIYLWTGKEIKYIGFSGGSGDMCEYDITDYSFPISSGVKNKVFINYLYEEAYPYPENDNCSESAPYFTIIEENKIMELRKDTLIEVDSKYRRLRNYVSSHFPKLILRNTSFGDLNQDGVEDALCFITADPWTNDAKSKSSPRIVAIFYGKADSTYMLYSSNKAIVNNKYNAVNFKIHKKGFEVEVIILQYNGNNEGTYFSAFDFQYDSTDSTFIWNSKTEGFTEDVDCYEWCKPWEINTKYFKNTRITFDKAWPNSELFSDDY